MIECRWKLRVWFGNACTRFICSNGIVICRLSFDGDGLVNKKLFSAWLWFKKWDCKEAWKNARLATVVLCETGSSVAKVATCLGRWDTLCRLCDNGELVLRVRKLPLQ